MQPYEPLVEKRSDYYIYTASASARKLYFYPLLVGYFYYKPNYYLKRTSFDSFLILLIMKGSCEIRYKDTVATAKEGEVVLLDCYSPHEFGSKEAWEAYLLYFDGPLAREYFNHISVNLGIIILPRNLQTVEQTLGKIYDIFRQCAPIREANISKYIVNILTELLLSKFRKTSLTYALALENTISYINEHFGEQLTLQDLAANASLSLFHFTRVFARETGMTPHQYLIATRLNAAKFLLKSTSASVKEIAYRTGFCSESSFCSTFKKWEHLTPTEYRDIDVCIT